MGTPEVWTKPQGDPRKVVMTLGVYESGRLANLFDEPVVAVSMRAMRQGFSPAMALFGVAEVMAVRALRARRGSVIVPKRLRDRDDHRLLSALALFGAFVLALGIGLPIGGTVATAFAILACVALAFSFVMLAVWSTTRVQAVLTRDKAHVVITGLDRASVQRFAQAIAEGHSGVTSSQDVWRGASTPPDDGIVLVDPSKATRRPPAEK